MPEPDGEQPGRDLENRAKEEEHFDYDLTSIVHVYNSWPQSTAAKCVVLAGSQERLLMIKLWHQCHAYMELIPSTKL